MLLSKVLCYGKRKESLFQEADRQKVRNPNDYTIRNAAETFEKMKDLSLIFNSLKTDSLNFRVPTEQDCQTSIFKIEIFTSHVFLICGWRAPRTLFIFLLASD